MNELDRVKTRQDEIAKTAEQERSHWHAAIDLFNERFVVPFKLEVKKPTGRGSSVMTRYST